MADESDYGSVRNEADNCKVEEDNKGDTKVAEGDNEESEEEALAYDRSNGETSEDSGEITSFLLRSIDIVCNRK